MQNKHITSQQEFAERIDRYLAELRTKLLEKNHDYSGTDDAFANLRKHWMKGVAIRTEDKTSRIDGFIERGTLHHKAESFHDACIDRAGYSLIMAAMHEEDVINQTEGSIKATRDNGNSPTNFRDNVFIARTGYGNNAPNYSAHDVLHYCRICNLAWIIIPMDGPNMEQYGWKKSASDLNSYVCPGCFIKGQPVSASTLASTSPVPDPSPVGKAGE